MPNSVASLSAAQLTSMRAAFATSLNDRCSIIRRVVVKNNAGGNVETDTVVHTNVPVAFGPFRVPFLKQLEVANTRVDAKSRWEFAFTYGTDVQIGDKIAVNGGFTYEIASHRSPQTFSLYVFYLAELID